VKEESFPKKDIDAITPAELVADVENGLRGGRSLNDIAKDFVQGNGKPVGPQILKNRLKDAEPGVVIVYRAYGKLERCQRPKA
jgi:hypothetical protein